MDRVHRDREPRLRRRVPRERLKTVWVGRSGASRLTGLLEIFADELSALPEPQPQSPPKAGETEDKEREDA